MKAAVLYENGKPIQVENNIDIIEPRAGEVRVNVAYCSLCHSDYSVISGAMGPIQGPIIVGHEAAGVIESVGEGVAHLAVGDHVILTPVPPCGHCYYCQRGDHSLCTNGHSIMTNRMSDGQTGLSQAGNEILRGVGVGALAEQVVCPASGAIKIPNDIPLDIACVVGCAVQTGVGAVLNTAKVEPGATVLVLGLGGIGLATVQGARLASASKIIVSDPLAERRELAMQLGATHTIDPTTEDVQAHAMLLTDGIGVDYAFETAGLASLIELGINASRAGGMTVCVGAPPIDQGISVDNVVIFTSMEKKLCGCLLGSCNSPYDIPRMMTFYQSKQLDLKAMVGRVRPLEEINEAFDDLHHGREIRTVMKIGG